MQKRDYIYLGIITILGIVVLVQGFNKKTQNIPNNTYNYKTDTTYLKKEYKELREEIKTLKKGLEGMVKTPPKNIYYYNTTQVTNPIDKIPDSLVYIVPKTNEKIVIADNYIKNFPKADKLIDFTLTREQLVMGLVDISGVVKQKDWPIYLDRYDYYWYGNSLHNIKREKEYKYSDPDIWKKLYINAGYDYIQQRAQVGIDYGVEIGRFKIQAGANLTIDKIPEMYGTTTIHYRLFK